MAPLHAHPAGVPVRVSVVQQLKSGVDSSAGNTPGVNHGVSREDSSAKEPPKLTGAMADAQTRFDRVASKQIKSSIPGYGDRSLDQNDQHIGSDSGHRRVVAEESPDPQFFYHPHPQPTGPVPSTVVGNDVGMVRIPLRGFSRAGSSGKPATGLLKLRLAPSLEGLLNTTQALCRFGGIVVTHAVLDRVTSTAVC